jgi:MFS transporter, putative metabolite transport protein
MATQTALDDLPITRFHRRVAFVAGGGPFCDGYLLGIIAVALPALTPELGLTALWEGLIASSALVGLFVGGVVFGPITDRIGRRLMYVLNLGVFVVGSIAQFYVTEAWQLLVLRLLIGLAIGADYPIATAMATEYIPRKMRGPALAGLVLAWWIGYAVSFAVGYAMSGVGGDSWRWMLVSGAVPAAVFLLLRAGIPESPRWLISAGRVEEARAVVRRCLGEHADFDALVQETREQTRSRVLGLSNIAVLFRRGYAAPLIFCSVFWICQVAPGFALRTYQPQLLSTFGVEHELGASVLIMVFPVLGIAFGLFFVNALGRRVLLIGSFAIFTAALLALSVTPMTIAAVTISLFIIFNMSEAAGSGLQFVYPNELFPTELRATGMGLATGMSRLGAAAGTFILPSTIETFGGSGALLIASGIGLVGLIVSWAMAPETRHLSLAQASAQPHSSRSAPDPQGLAATPQQAPARPTEH